MFANLFFNQKGYRLLAPQNQIQKSVRSKKIKRKFTAGQLKSLKLLLKSFTQSSIFVYSLMYKG